jgi:L-alanine-DL-glutamate epimerase-like enolase superfamily enzyme
VRIVRASVAAVAAPFPRPLFPGPEPLVTNTAVVAHLYERDGCVGFGYAPTFGFGTQAVRSFLADDLVPHLCGVDHETSASAVAALAARAAIAGRLAGAARVAISLVETALLDIEGKLAGRALHQLWGCAAAPTPAYASGGWRYLTLGGLVEFARSAVERGFGAVKIQIGLSPREDAQRLFAVRDAVGPDVAVMADANERIPPAAAEEWLDALDGLAPAWIEEPTPAGDHALLRSLRRRAARPIAAGEGETELGELMDLVTSRAVDVIQPDVYRVGFRALRAVGDAAAPAGLVFAPHMAHELSAHVTAVSPSSSSSPVWLEYFDWFEDWWDEPVLPVRGLISPPDRPGHGLALRPGWLAAHTL